MPFFNFNPISKKTNRHITSKKDKKYEVINKNIEGVVFINLNASFQVEVNGIRYNIKQECYSCKGIQKVYRLGYIINQAKLCYIRCKEECTELNPLQWLPFHAGCVVRGDVVLNKLINVQLFDIKKVYDEYNNISHIAIQFYMEHQNEINDTLRDKQFNETK